MNDNSIQEIQKLFDETISTVNDLLVVPKWNKATRKDLQYLDYDKELQEVFNEPIASLIYWDVLLITNEDVFFKIKSKNERINFLRNADTNIAYNLIGLHHELFFNLREIIWKLKDELNLIKEDLLSKAQFLNNKELRNTLIQNLNEFKPAHEVHLNYIKNDNFSEKYPFLPESNDGYLDLFEGRFNYIAGNALVHTKGLYGLPPLMAVEQSDNFYNHKSFQIDKEHWFENERRYTFHHLYSQALTILKRTNSLSNNTQDNYTYSIFEDGYADILHNILIETNAIDKNNRPVNRKFQPICHAFYMLNKDETFALFKKTSTLSEYIEYLNNPEVYDAMLKNNSKLSSGQNYYETVKNLIKRRIE